MLENLYFEFVTYPLKTTVAILAFSIVILITPVAQLQLYLSNRKKNKQSFPKKTNQILYGTAVAITIILEAAMFIYYAGDYGEPVGYFFLENGNEVRIAALFEKQARGKGLSYCRLRTFSTSDGQLIGQSEFRRSAGCQTLGGTGAVLWLKAHGKSGVQGIEGREGAIAVDLFTGKVLGTIESLLQNKLPNNGEYKLKQVIDNNFIILTQDNSLQAVSPDVPEGSLGAVRLLVDNVWTKSKRSEYFRSIELVAPSKESQQCCDTLIYHYSTAFGEGDRYLSWLDNMGKQKWSKPYRDVLDTERDPMAVAWKGKNVFIVSPGPGHVHKVLLTIIKSSEGRLINKFSL